MCERCPVEFSPVWVLLTKLHHYAHCVITMGSQVLLGVSFRSNRRVRCISFPKNHLYLGVLLPPVDQSKNGKPFAWLYIVSPVCARLQEGDLEDHTSRCYDRLKTPRGTLKSWEQFVNEVWQLWSCSADDYRPQIYYWWLQSSSLKV